MLWTAFTIGLFGSLHCVGMCGPIPMAKSAAGTSKSGLAGRLLLYNFGRIITYVLLGVMVGALGFGAELAGWQSTLSVVAGVFLLLAAVFSFNVEYHLLRLPAFGQWQVWLRRKLGKYFGSNTYSSWLRTGFFNGFLPCGLVYAAVIGAVLTGSILQSAMYMSLFGLGTIPLMFFTVFIGKLSVSPWQVKLRRLYPTLLIALGILFIMRGVNFDLPYGFDFLNPMSDVPMCH